MRVRVYYADTDAGGVVYYANYLRWLEMARFELFESLGLSMAEYARQGIHFAVVHLEIDYHGSAMLGDELQVNTEVAQVRRVRFSLTNCIVRSADNRQVATAFVTLACVNSQGKVLGLPSELAECLRTRMPDRPPMAGP